MPVPKCVLPASALRRRKHCLEAVAFSWNARREVGIGDTRILCIASAYVIHRLTHVDRFEARVVNMNVPPGLSHLDRHSAGKVHLVRVKAFQIANHVLPRCVCSGRRFARGAGGGLTSAELRRPLSKSARKEHTKQESKRRQKPDRCRGTCIRSGIFHRANIPFSPFSAFLYVGSSAIRIRPKWNNKCICSRFPIDRTATVPQAYHGL